MRTDRVVPRRCDLLRMTAAERAIYDAVGVVEAAGASIALTDAVVLLDHARAAVADHVDGIERTAGISVGHPVVAPNLAAYNDQELGQFACHLRGAARSLRDAHHMASLPKGCDRTRAAILEIANQALRLVFLIDEHRAARPKA